MKDSVSRCSGTLIGQVVEVENGSYTSQLSVTISSDMIGQNIECITIDTHNESTVVGSLTIPPTSMAGKSCITDLIIFLSQAVTWLSGLTSLPSSSTK